MQFHLQICAIVALGVTDVTLSASLPSIFKKCKPEDESCLKSSAEYAIANLGNGLKELGIDSIDPLHIGTTEVLPKPGPVSLYQRYDDNKVGYLTKLNVKQFRVNLDKCEMSLETFHPELLFYGNYTLKGNFLGEEIDARGKGNALVGNTALTVTMTCEKYTKDNEEYLRVTDVKTSCVPGQPITVHFGEVIKGNDEYNKKVDTFLKENPRTIIDPALGPVQDDISHSVRDISNKVFSKYSLKEIFDIK